MPPDGVVGHGLGVREPQERPAAARRSGPFPRRRAASSRPAWRCRPRRTAPRASAGASQGSCGPGNPTKRKKGSLAFVVLDPAHRLRAVPGVDVGLERDGHRRRVPHRHALGGVLPVLVVALVAAVGDVLLVGLEQAFGRQVVGVAGRDLRHELVAGLEHLGEPQRLQAARHLVHVRDARASRRGRGGPCPAARCGSPASRRART